MSGSGGSLATGPGPVAAGSTGLRDYLRIARRQWLLVTACLLLSVGAAAVLTLRATPQYESDASLFVSSPEGTVVQAYQGALFAQQRMASYAGMVTGKEIARRVVDRLHLDESPADVAERVRATVQPDSLVLTVTVTDTDPRRAQRLAETTADVFAAFVTRLETPAGSDRSPVKATVVDRAALPSAPVSPRPVHSIALAIGIGLLAGVGCAVLRESLDTSIRSADDLAASIGTTLLATVGTDPRGAERPLITALESHAPRAEAFRVLRTNLQFVDVDQSSKAFVVTSAGPGEGKTTTALNLAIALTQVGQRVVVVEADVRRPKFGDYLHIEPAVGLTTVLVGRVGVADALQSWGTHGLAVLASGEIPPNPAELLQSRAMSEVLDKLRARFDIVLVDAPPLLPVTDAALLARVADGALLVVRHGTATRDQVRAAAGRLGAVGARLVGAVITMTPARDDGYGGGAGYGYAPLPGRRRA